MDLTDDLDTIYARMMAMTTDGGDEYVGWVLNDAVKTMSWSTDPKAARIVFVAGNESADQAAEHFNFRQVAEHARQLGIIINAIYAGGEAAGISEHWNEVALHGGGSYTAIDMAQGTVQIATPHDKVLVELDVELNATYIPYGIRGAQGKANQQAQDVNAARMGEQSRASRAGAKAGKLYNNAYWDLVDACRQEGFKLDDVRKDDLPEKMRSMTIAERKAYVDGMLKSREAVQKRIQEVNIARSQFLQDAQRDSGKTSLDDALRRAIREQLQSKGFTFSDER